VRFLPTTTFLSSTRLELKIWFKTSELNSTFFLEEIAYTFSLEIKEPIQEGTTLKVWGLARSMASLARV